MKSMPTAIRSLKTQSVLVQPFTRKSRLVEFLEDYKAAGKWPYIIGIR
jgi:hypothetical protein